MLVQSGGQLVRTVVSSQTTARPATLPRNVISQLLQSGQVKPVTTPTGTYTSLGLLMIYMTLYSHVHGQIFDMGQWY